MSVGSPDQFGVCCPALAEALAAPRSTFRVEAGVLYLRTGSPIHRGPLFYDHAVFFCPFCGRPLQTPDKVAKMIQDAPTPPPKKRGPKPQS